MTLILVAANKHHVIQVADRRLTAKGKVQEDDAVKCIVAKCANARFSVTFTELATCGPRFRTDTWLVDQLIDLTSKGLEVGDIVDALTQAATAQIASLNASSADRRLKIVLAGYGYPAATPFIATISNFGHESGAGQRNYHATEMHFSSLWTLVSPGFRLEDVQWWVPFGYYPAITSGIRKQVQRKLKEGLYRSSDTLAIVKNMESVIRWSNKTPKHGTMVGSFCIYAVVPRDPSCQMYGGSLPDSPEKRCSPHMVGLGSGFRHIQTAEKAGVLTFSLEFRVQQPSSTYQP
jgi:hypothetical protein